MIHSSHQKVKKKGVHNEFDEKAIVDFDVNGALAASHTGHGTDMGFASAVLGRLAVRAGLNLLLGGTLFGGNIL